MERINLRNDLVVRYGSVNPLYYNKNNIKKYSQYNLSIVDSLMEFNDIITTIINKL